jgi:hypothetical protein
MSPVAVDWGDKRRNNSMVKGPYVNILCDGSDCKNAIEVEYIEQYETLVRTYNGRLLIDTAENDYRSIKLTYGWNVIKQYPENKHYCPDCKDKYDEYGFVDSEPQS